MRTLQPLLRGAVAGLVAGLLLTTLQAAARLLIGVATPAELVGDRVAPLLTIDQFFGLFGLFGGYNGLKQAGILGGTGGQLLLGVVLGAAVGLLARRSVRRAWQVLAAVSALGWVGLNAALWPILSTNFAGFPSDAARVLTLAVTAVSVAAFALLLAGVLRVLGGVPAGSVAGSAAGPVSPGRRALLAGGVGAAGLGLTAATGALGTTLYRRATFSYDGLSYSGPDLLPITPNDRFYTVTKNVVDPDVAAARWRLAVDGAVRTPASYDLAALRDRTPTEQETTLMCISNPVGGGLESNARWTGVPLADLITAAGPSDDAVEVLLTAVDGYTDTFSIEKALDPTTLLAYAMNGEDVPRRHGFPVRLVVPGRYGEKNLKWISKVEIVTEERKGFYETQGWGPDFVVPTRARFIGAPPEAGRGAVVVLRGTALGGDRGVSRVEVSTDDGRTWADARITYPGTRLTWSLWRFDWRPEVAGATTLVVRATDGTGTPQIAEAVGSVPQGARGYHRVPVTVV